MDIDKKYSEDVMYGGTFDAFINIVKILNKEVSNTDYSHLAICKKEAEAHLMYIELSILNFGKIKEFAEGIMYERTELCKRYLNFLKFYKNGIDNR